MKKICLCILLFYCLGKASAQSWNIQGNSGLTTNNFLGTTDNKDLIFKVNSLERGRLVRSGSWQFGRDTNFLKIDSAGKLSFSGLGDYYVSANRYIFRSVANPKIGLFYNSTGSTFDFRNNNGQSIFSLNTTSGNAVLTGTLKIGKYTLPKNDGGIGQVLKTDGAGNLAWANDNGTNFRAGNGIDIDGGVISATNIKTDALLNTGVGAGVLYSNTAGADNTATGFKSLFGNTTGNENTANGFLALNANTTGYSNAAFGAYSLALNTIGSQNTATGDGALYHNTTGIGNTSDGFGALFFNTKGTYNAALGNHALQTNTIGNENTAIGNQALFSNSTGLKNVAIGSNALFNNTTASDVVAIGAYALFNQKGDSGTAYGNIAVGSKALYNNTTGYLNTSNGFNALEGNTTGFDNSAFGAYALVGSKTGTGNCAIGFAALSQNSGGSVNTATGASALQGNTTGNNNTATGYQAIKLNTTGGGNTAQGSFALGSNATGNYNTGIGYFTDVTSSNLSNATAIGYGANVDASNKVRIGNTDVTSIGGQVGWTTFSDGRYKKNIKEDVQGLKFINLLKPVSYTVDVNALNDYLNKNKEHDSVYEKIKEAMRAQSDKASENILNGFIAQDVEKAARTLHYNFSGVDKPGTTDGLYGLRYSDFVVPLVKAVQELSKMNDDKISKIDSLQKQNESLQYQFQELKTLVLKIQQSQQQSSPGNAATTITSTQQNASQQYLQLFNAASLEQNVPNPFTNSTSINYYLPQKFSSAKIIITDRTGKTLQELNLTHPGKGTIYINASMLASGAYNYSLYTNGRLITTKQMVSAK